jgi:hypothetical protein
MRFQRPWCAAAALTFLLAGAAYAYRALHPVTVEAADFETASALLASLRGSPASEPSSPASVARDVWRSQDNTRGVEFVLSDGRDGYVATFEPFTPPAAYASHLTDPTTPAFGWVEIDVAGVATRYAMTDVNGTLITRCSVPFHLGATVKAACWEAGADWNDEEQAFFWMTVPVLVQ